MPYVANALSRVDLREYARWIRKIAGLTNKPYFPIIKFLEHVMPDMFPGFNCEIVDDAELRGIEGLTIPKDNLILLPNSVYNDAVDGKGRARFSVAHEVSHYMIIDDSSIALARLGCHVPAYRDPEWQANALASEILIVPRLSSGMSAKQIEKVFGVSNKAARIHINQKLKEGLP